MNFHVCCYISSSRVVLDLIKHKIVNIISTLIIVGRKLHGGKNKVREIAREHLSTSKDVIILNLNFTRSQSNYYLHRSSYQCILMCFCFEAYFVVRFEIEIIIKGRVNI